MSVGTTYDKMRDDLREDMTSCLQKAKMLIDEDIWGYNELKEDYAINIYQAIKKIRDII